jgi:hypothetical protein
MMVKLPDGREIEVEVEMDGYKPLDIYDAKGNSLIYDRELFGLSQAQADKIYMDAQANWVDDQCAYADGLRKAAKECG